MLADSGWKVLMDDVLDGLAELRASVNGLIAGNGENWAEVRERLAHLESRGPKCPGECRAHLEELRREIQNTALDMERVRALLAKETDRTRADTATALEQHRKEQFEAIDKRMDAMTGRLDEPRAAHHRLSWAQFSEGVTLRGLLIWSAVVAVAVAIALGMKECLPVLLDWIGKRLAGL